ncbi:MAG: hypothetical protein J0M34_01720 [Alphaproteobacteria bacterium]|nr:hypothetical protein [Alphaproteobacteria bacterium]
MTGTTTDTVKANDDTSYADILSNDSGVATIVPNLLAPIGPATQDRGDVVVVRAPKSLGSTSYVPDYRSPALGGIFAAIDKDNATYDRQQAQLASWRDGNDDPSNGLPSYGATASVTHDLIPDSVKAALAVSGVTLSAGLGNIDQFSLDGQGNKIQNETDRAAVITGGVTF